LRDYCSLADFSIGTLQNQDGHGSLHVPSRQHIHWIDYLTPTITAPSTGALLTP
jgi:hypothetical protein